MKNKIRFGIAVLTVAAIAAFNVYLNTNSYNLSDVSLTNVEALAWGEENDDPTVPRGVDCSPTFDGNGATTQIFYCAECGYRLSKPQPITGRCTLPGCCYGQT